MKLYDETDPVACAREAARLLGMANATRDHHKNTAIDIIGADLRRIESFLMYTSQGHWNLDRRAVEEIVMYTCKIRLLVQDAKIVIDEKRRQALINEAERLTQSEMPPVSRPGLRLVHSVGR